MSETQGLTVYGTARNRTFRVLWMLEELGLAYEQEAEAPRSEAVRALNPSGKVPVLLADGQVLTESLAILTFLADREGRMTAPPGTHARARQDAFSLQVLDEMDALLWTAARHSFVLPEERRVPGIKDSLRWEWDRNLPRIADRMAGGFAMGEEITVPDILLTHCLGWGVAAKFGIPDARLADYLDRMRSRPAYIRARA